MELFSQIVHDLSTFPCMEAWNEAQAVFQHAASQRPEHWLLPVKACKAVGGLQEQAIPAMIAIGCAHLSIVLVDDMLDGDPRGEFHRIGMPGASNMACAFQAAALYAISQYAHENQSIVIGSFNEMFLYTAFGQFLDVHMPVNESAYWRVVRTKSSPFFGVALQTGALAGGGSLEVAQQLKKLGSIYGEMIQIHDDIHDSMETPANPDWIQGRSPLPILFASLVEHPDRKRFLELNQNISKPEALQEAQEILIRCGAISYCTDQLIRKHRSAKELLKNICLTDLTPISTLFDEIITPVYQLLETFDTPQDIVS